MMLFMSEVTSSGAIPQLTLGWRLKMALGDYGAAEIARDLGVDRSTVSRWMADRGAPPKAAYVKQWALITRVDSHWLQTGEAPTSSDKGPGGGMAPPSSGAGPTSRLRHQLSPGVTGIPHQKVNTGILHQVPVGAAA